MSDSKQHPRSTPLTEPTLGSLQQHLGELRKKVEELNTACKSILQTLHQTSHNLRAQGTTFQSIQSTQEDIAKKLEGVTSEVAKVTKPNRQRSWIKLARIVFATLIVLLLAAYPLMHIYPNMLRWIGVTGSTSIDPGLQQAQFDRIEASLNSVELPKGLAVRLDNSTKAVEAVDAQGKELAAKMVTLNQHIKDLEKAAAAAKLPEDWSKHVATLNKLPDAAKTLGTIESRFENMDRTLMNNLQKLSLSAETKVTALDAQVQGVKSELAEFNKQLKLFNQSVVGQLEGQDVLIVALNTPRLKVNRHLKAYQEVFRDLPRSKDGATRFGLVVAVTAQLTPKILLTDENIKWNITDPIDGATEVPEDFGVALKQMFDPKRPHQRAILVASSSCDPLSANENGWKDVSEVDVVLIQMKNEEENKNKLKAWQEFCRQRRGYLQVVASGTDEQQGAQLAAVLRLLCQRKSSH